MFAKTTYKNVPKEPMIKIPQETCNGYPEIENIEEDDDTKFTQTLNEAGQQKLIKITDDAKCKIGIKPITQAMIKK